MKMRYIYRRIYISCSTYTNEQFYVLQNIYSDLELLLLRYGHFPELKSLSLISGPVIQHLENRLTPADVDPYLRSGYHSSKSIKRRL